MFVSAPAVAGSSLGARVVLKIINLCIFQLLQQHKDKTNRDKINALARGKEKRHIAAKRGYLALLARVDKTAICPAPSRLASPCQYFQTYFASSHFGKNISSACARFWATSLFYLAHPRC